MAASQKSVCITQQKCHVLTLSHDYSVINDESNKKPDVFFHLLKILVSLGWESLKVLNPIFVKQPLQNPASSIDLNVI
jgi:hypothetical protein